MAKKWIDSSVTPPPEDKPFWGYLFHSGIRLLEWWSPEKCAEKYGGKADEYEGGFSEIMNDESDWKPRFWLPQDAIPATPSE